jgi:hypothetical protein
MVFGGEKPRELEGNMLRGNCVNDESHMKSPGDEIEVKLLLLLHMGFYPMAVVM